MKNIGFLLAMLLLFSTPFGLNASASTCSGCIERVYTCADIPDGYATDYRIDLHNENAKAGGCIRHEPNTPITITYYHINSGTNTLILYCDDDISTDAVMVRGTIVSTASYPGLEEVTSSPCELQEEEIGFSCAGHEHTYYSDKVVFDCGPEGHTEYFCSGYHSSGRNKPTSPRFFEDIMGGYLPLCIYVIVPIIVIFRKRLKAMSVCIWRSANKSRQTLFNSKAQGGTVRDGRNDQ